MLNKRGLRSCLILLLSTSIPLLLRVRSSACLICGAPYENSVELRVFIVAAVYFYDGISDSSTRAWEAMLRHRDERGEKTESKVKKVGRLSGGCGKDEVAAASLTKEACTRFACGDFVSGFAREKVHRESAVQSSEMSLSPLLRTETLICIISEKKRLPAAIWPLASPDLVRTVAQSSCP